MARKSAPQPPTPDPELNETREEVAQKIGDRIALGEELLGRAIANEQELATAEND